MTDTLDLDHYPPQPAPADWLTELREKIRNGNIIVAPEYDDTLDIAPTTQRLYRRFKFRAGNNLTRYLRELEALENGQLEPNALYVAFRGRWAKRRHGHESALIMGGEGSGKSVCMVWACREQALSEQTWAFIDAIQIMEYHEHRDRDAVSRCKRTGLLCIDEIFDIIQLGGRYLGLLRAIIKARHRQDLPTIVSTWLSERDLRKRVGPELVDKFALRISTAEESARESERIHAEATEVVHPYDTD